MKPRSTAWIKGKPQSHAHVDPIYSPEPDELPRTSRVTQHGERLHPYRQRTVQRPSFRETVRTYLASHNGEGVPRTQVMEHFAGFPTSKVTIALNELLFRREAYLRAGIYRLTERLPAQNHIGLVINKTT